jgi:hypothetical protein
MDNLNDHPSQPEDKHTDPVKTIKHLKEELKKEPADQKYLVISALVAFLATLLPWYQFLAYSANGWSQSGFLCVLGSIGLIALWALPKLKIELPAFAKDKNLVEKILVIVMLAGPVLTIVQSSFRFSYFGIGLYLALLASVAAAYLKFQKK